MAVKSRVTGVQVERLLREPKHDGTLDGRRLLLRSDGTLATVSLDRVRGMAKVWLDVYIGDVRACPIVVSLEPVLTFRTPRDTWAFFCDVVQVIPRPDLGHVATFLVEVPIAPEDGTAPTIEDELGLPRTAPEDGTAPTVEDELGLPRAG